MPYSPASSISCHALTAMVVSLHLVPDTLPIAMVALSASLPSLPARLYVPAQNMW